MYNMLPRRDMEAEVESGCESWTKRKANESYGRVFGGGSNDLDSKV